MPGMLKEMPRRENSDTAEARATLVPMAYWLFSMMYTTGSFHSSAMLKLS